MDYDPLLAKLIGYGSDRQQSITRVQRVLAEYFVGGIKTNVSLFQRILSDSDFQSGNVDTGYLERLLGSDKRSVAANAPESSEPTPEMIAAIAAGMFAALDTASPSETNGDLSRQSSSQPPVAPSQWKRQSRIEGLR
jgi:acetyl-CoA carboxylase biotin carboxylase subunit